MKELDLSPEAPWRQRFQATNILSAVVARQNPERGLVCTNKDGIYQLYAWDIPSNELIQYYGIERLLYRLSVSEYADKFVLKGALMFNMWGMTGMRPTRDLHHFL